MTRGDKDPYARANLFVGKYKVPRDGHVRLPATTRVRVLRGVVTSAGWMQSPNGGLWLIVDDGDDFWPVMVRLNSLDDLVEEEVI